MKKILLLLCCFLMHITAVYASIDIKQNKTNKKIIVIVQHETMLSLLQALYKKYKIIFTVNTQLAQTMMDVNVRGETLLQTIQRVFRDYNLAIIQRKDKTIQSIMILPASTGNDIPVGKQMTIGVVSKIEHQRLQQWQRRTRDYMHGIHTRRNHQDKKTLRQQYPYHGWH